MVVLPIKGAGLISDNYGAQQIGKNVTALGEFLPGIGDAAAGDEFGRAVAEGDNLGMGLAALGAIPVVGDAAKKGATLYRGQPKNKNLKINDEGLLWVTPDKDYANDPHYGGKDGAEVLELETSKDLNLYDTSKDIDYLIAKGKEKGINRPLVVSAAKGNFRALKDPEIQSMLRESGYDGFKAIEPEGQPSVALFDTRSVKPIKQANQSLPMDEVRKLSYKEKAKVASEWKTGQPIKLSFARNKESSKNYPSGMDLGQKLEPSGRYMNVDFDDSGFNKNIPNWEFGEIEFKNPLVLEHKSTNSTGWKKDLSEMFGGSTGKRLTNKIKKAGHDGIITKDADGFNETISIR